MIYIKIAGPSELRKIISNEKMIGHNSGTEAKIYYNEKEVLKWFHTPLNIKQDEICTQEKGNALKQLSFSFFKEIFHCKEYVYAGKKIFYDEDLKITTVPFDELTINFNDLVKDIKIISDANIEIVDDKTFNMLHTTEGFRIIDTTRFVEYTIKGNQLFNQNLNRIMGLIEFDYFKGLKNTPITKAIEDSLLLPSLKRDYENWDQFMCFFKERIKIYCDKDVKSLDEAVQILVK